MSDTHELIDYIDKGVEQVNDLKLRLQITSKNDRSDLIALLEEMENFKHKQLMRPSPSMSYRQGPRL